jgi:hypothetical protein
MRPNAVSVTRTTVATAKTPLATTTGTGKVPLGRARRAGVWRARSGARGHGCPGVGGTVHRDPAGQHDEAENRNREQDEKRGPGEPGLIEVQVEDPDDQAGGGKQDMTEITGARRRLAVLPPLLPSCSMSQMANR